MSILIDVPPGLNGVAVTDTSIGDVDGEAGFFHYRGHDATDLARRVEFDEAWHLVARGHLPDVGELERSAPRSPQHDRCRLRCSRCSSRSPRPRGPTLGRLRAAVSIAADELGLRPLIDLAPEQRAAQGLRVAAVIPTIVGALHRVSLGHDPIDNDATLGPAAAYLRAVTGETPTPAAVRALEHYLILTIDHGFNASTFTARVVASTGADMANVVGAALGALAGPLHGGAPSRALDALDAIGDPANTEAWVTAEVAAGRRIMGFGHAVYRTRDPRSALLREVAVGLGGELVDQAIEVEGRILATLARLKPDHPLPSNVEFFAGVVMAAAGLPRALFTPTFAVSRSIAWVTHAVEQAAIGKLIRPSASYVGPPVL